MDGNNLPAVRTFETQSGLRELPEIGATVYSKASQRQIEVTAVGQRLMMQLHGQLVRSKIDTAVLLSEIRATELYVQIGFDHFNAYVEEGFGGIMGVRQAHYYAAIGDKIRTMITAAQQIGAEQKEAVTAALAPMGFCNLRELSKLPEEALKKIGHGDEYIGPHGEVVNLAKLKEAGLRDLQDMNKGLRRESTVKDERIKTLEAELDAMRKRMNGDTTVAQQFAGRIEELQQEIEQIRGRRERGEAAAAQIEKASKLMEEAFAYIRPYMPDKLSDLDEMPEEIELAIGLVSRIRTRLDNLFQQWILLDMQRSQPGG